MTEMLRRAGYDVVGYDVNFLPLPDGWDHTLRESFDAVVSTEVFEHFRDPAAEMDRIVKVLKPGGVLVVMTSIVDDSLDLASWSYANDATHVLFYSMATFRYIARRWGFRIVDAAGNRLILLERAI